MQNKKLDALIVDTDLEVSGKLTKLLYETTPIGLVLHVMNYTDAMNVLRNRKISLLLVEIVLPGRNGIEILRTVRDKAYSAQVIMLSKTPNNYYRDMCTLLGAAYFFDKSDDLEKIPFIISQLKALQHQERFT